MAPSHEKILKTFRKKMLDSVPVQLMIKNGSLNPDCLKNGGALTDLDVEHFCSGAVSVFIGVTNGEKYERYWHKFIKGDDGWLELWDVLTEAMRPWRGEPDG